MNHKILNKTNLSSLIFSSEIRISTDINEITRTAKYIGIVLPL